MTGKRRRMIQPVDGERIAAPRTGSTNMAVGSTAAGWRRIARVAHAYCVLPHAMPILVVLAATAGFAVIAADGMPAASVLSRLLLAMLGGQVAIGAVNEVVDREFDATVRPTKPIPAGYVTVRGAMILTASGLVAMTALSASFGWASLALCTLGTGAGLAYDLWLKRTLLSWLPYLIALPLLPLWVFTALRGFEPRLLLLYPLGAMTVVGVHLSQALPDVARDRAGAIRSITSLLGERRSILLCWAATLTAPVLASIAAPFLADRPRFVWLAAAIVCLLVGGDAAIYASRPRRGVMACFPCVAVAAVVMGLGWVIGVG